MPGMFSKRSIRKDLFEGIGQSDAVKQKKVWNAIYSFLLSQAESRLVVTTCCQETEHDLRSSDQKDVLTQSTFFVDSSFRQWSVLCQAIRKDEDRSSNKKKKKKMWKADENASRVFFLQKMAERTGF